MSRFIFDFLLALAPGIAWILYIRRRDRYEPEPGPLLARAFLSGVVLVPAARIAERALSAGGIAGVPLLPVWAHLALVVAPVEELLKFAVTRAWFYPHPEFDEPVDGIVYATSVAIGFASMENALYMVKVGVAIGMLRSMISTLLHLGCSGLVGHALGQQKFTPRRFRVAGALVLAIVGHAAFDVLTVCTPQAEASGTAAFAVIALLSLLLGLYTVLDEQIKSDLRASPFRRRYLRAFGRKRR